jgi:hypothetical protein
VNERVSPSDLDFLNDAPPVDPIDTIIAPADAARRDPLKPLTYSEIKRDKGIPWLIGSRDAPVLPRRGLVQNLGLYKSAKTFFSLDQAFCIAYGLPFHGLAVMQGRVAYVIAEGGSELNFERIEALFAEHEKELREKYGIGPEISFDAMVEQLHDSGRFAFIPSAVNLANEKDPQGVDRLLDLLNEFRGEGEPFVALWLDTWMRMLQSAGGHDSDAESVNASLKGCDRIRAALDCVVVMVAHVGVSKGAKGRPNGLSDASAAIDGAIYCEKRGEGSEALYSARAINQRHAVEGFQMFFKLGKPSQELPSVVLRSARRQVRGLTPKQDEWFSLLRGVTPEGLSQTEWRDKGVELGIAASAKSANTSLARAIKELTGKRLIRFAEEVFYVANDFDEDDADAFEE